MIVKFKKLIDRKVELKKVKDPEKCPFCKTKLVQIMGSGENCIGPGDTCKCGAIVMGIYGDKEWPVKK